MAQEDSGFPIGNGYIQTPIIGSTDDIPNLPAPPKKKRNLPGTPDPEAEVISLSPKTLMATNRFLCEICGKGFQRDQNLQLHRRGHNLPWKLKQRNSKDPIRKRVYVCPEKTCVHHNPARALGDLTGIKKHFCRKHGEKKWKCDKCSKRYAVQSDWKAHSKTCGTREYKCDCGTVFSRRDSFITHRAFCDALAEETARVNAASRFNIATALANGTLDYSNFVVNSPALINGLMSQVPQPPLPQQHQHQHQQQNNSLPVWIMNQQHPNSNGNQNHNVVHQDGMMVNSHPQLGSNSVNAFYQNPTTAAINVTCSNPLPQQQGQGQGQGQGQDHYHHGYNMSWFLGSTENSSNKLPLSNNGGVNKNGEDHQLPLMMSTRVTSGDHQDLLVGTSSVPSLFSNQQQQQRTPAPIMSATALLQKAAQIGATSTTDPLFLGAGSLIAKASANNNNINSTPNDVHHVMASNFGGCDGEGGGGGYGGSSSTITTTANLVGSDVESTANEFSPINPQMADMYNNNPMKRRRVMLQGSEQHHHHHHQQQDQNGNSVVNGGGETRDFLGVGIQQQPAGICHPSTVNGWI